MKQMSGYFGGYISKKQKHGQFELKKSISALPLLKDKIVGKNYKTASSQLALVTNRCFTVLEGKGMLRPATEDFLLANRYKAHDELAAEFIRTFRHSFFYGLYFVKRYEALMNNRDTIDVNILLPKAASDKTMTDQVSLYGFRSTDPRVFFLSPWEFVQWVKPHALEKPQRNYHLTKWVHGKEPVSNDGTKKSFYTAGVDYVLNDSHIKGLEHILTFPCRDEIANPTFREQYSRFRNSWVLVMRNRPVVPCPENTPLPSRKSTKDYRAKLCSVYLRPWTLIPEQATVEVPRLQDLHLTKAQWESLASAAQVAGQRKRRISQKSQPKPSTEASSSTDQTSCRTAWKDYLTRIPPTSEKQIKNFILACMAEGRNYDDDETGNSTNKMDGVTCDIDVTEVHKMLASSVEELSADQTEQQATTRAPKPDLSQSFARVKRATQAAGILIAMQQKNTKDNQKRKLQHRAIAHARQKVEPELADSKGMDGRLEERKTEYDIYKSNWKLSYEEWKQKICAAQKQPYDAQWQVLNTVHQRCVLEHQKQLKHDVEIPEDLPLLRLVHGLPGSGKTQLMKWLRSYFETVWQWALGDEFAFVAPLNSMAANIDGSTIHSWGEIAFKDRRGQFVAGNKSAGRDVSSMNVKCSILRFLLIDEIEASGAELLAELEDHVSKNIGGRTVHKKVMKSGEVKRRLPFGGINVIFFGDFWQLNPTGQIAVMQNPYGEAALSKAAAANILYMFWRRSEQSLQAWTANEARILHLKENQRSGADMWFSEILNACRLGQLSDEDYNFLHGFPTRACGSHLSGTQSSSCARQQNCPFNSSNRMSKFDDQLTAVIQDLDTDSWSWQAVWKQFKLREEETCPGCAKERKRRARVLQCGNDCGVSDEEGKEILNSERFVESLLITEFNRPVCLYSLLRAQVFAQERKQQLFWIQAVPILIN